MKEIGEIWDSVRDAEAGDAEYKVSSPDFKARLGDAAAMAREGKSSGIAGLEKFEEAVAKDADKRLTHSGVDAARVGGGQAPSVFDAGARAARATESGAEGDAKLTETGSGAQEEEGKEKAAKDAAAAGSRIEASEVHSPRAGAARPLAAEAPGNTAKATTKTATKSAKKK